jgi:hypothetical protein
VPTDAGRRALSVRPALLASLADWLPFRVDDSDEDVPTVHAVDWPWVGMSNVPPAMSPGFDCLKVAEVIVGRVAVSMVDVPPIWDRAIGLLPDPAMLVDLAAFDIGSEIAIGG